MKQRILGFALCALVALLPLSGARATSITYQIKDGSATTRSVEAFSCGTDGSGNAIICPGYTPQDMTGAALGVSGNPFFVTGSVGITGTLPPFASTPSFNCASGCSSTGGSFNNNSDGVATSSTNGQNAGWLYGWNGSSWDRVRTDTTNGVWVNVKSSAPMGSTTDAPCTLPASTTACSGIALQKAQVNAINSPGSPNVTLHDCSGTIASAGTAQNAITAQTTLHGFILKNIDASSGSGEPLWFSMTTTAAASGTASYPLAPPAATSFAGGESFTAPPFMGTNSAVSVVAATAGHKYSCTWW